MKAKDFVRLDASGMIFRVVDASKPGYMAKPCVLVEADKNVVTTNYGECEIVGFENASKRTMIIYVKY